jgi:prevent-host-death family protein
MRMSMTLNVAEAKASLSRLVAAALAGDDVYIARAGMPAVRLVPVEEPGQRVFGRWPCELDDDAQARSMAPLDAGELAAWGIE